MTAKSVTYYTCDRCKRHWREKGKPDFVNIQARDHFNEVTSWSWRNGKDLCPDCWDDFERFMRGGKVVDDAER